MFLLFLVDLFCPGLPGGLIIYQFLVVLVVVVFVFVVFGCFVLPWFTWWFNHLPVFGCFGCRGFVFVVFG